MHRTCLLLAVILTSPVCAVAQTQNQTTADPEIQKYSPPVVLTPIQQKSTCDLSLIDDVCEKQERRTYIYRVKRASAADVAKSVNRWLQATLTSKEVKVDGFICNAPVIIVPEVKSNSLIVSTTNDFAYAEQLENMIEKLDQAPKMIRISAVVKKSVNGSDVTIASPTILAIENTTGIITIGPPNDQITIELTGQMVDPQENTADVYHNATKDSLKTNRK